MGSAFHQLCPRYSGTLTPTAPTAIRLWDTVTFYLFGTGLMKTCCFGTNMIQTFCDIDLIFCVMIPKEQMGRIVGILTFMSRKIFMLS